VERIARWPHGGRVDGHDLADALDRIARTPARTFPGRDAGGEPVVVDRGVRTAATLNRYRTSIGAVLTWAKRRRLMPRGWTGPARDVPCEREGRPRAVRVRGRAHAPARGGADRRLGFHDLRQTHASYLARSGASLLEVSDSLVHESPAMTRRFGHLTVDG
jgi:integrase